MYAEHYSREIKRKISKLAKKNPVWYSILWKQIDKILQNPSHNYKILKQDMQGKKRIHIGHFVLIFEIDHVNKTISFEDFDHHDNIYK